MPVDFWPLAAESIKHKHFINELIIKNLNGRGIEAFHVSFIFRQD